MLEYVKYNLGRECELYAKIPLGQKSKGRAIAVIKKEILHTRLNIRTTLQISSSGGLHGREKKKDKMLNISTLNRSNDRGRYERFPRTTTGSPWAARA